MKRISILLLLLIPLLAKAQSVLTIEEAVRLALENNYSIQIAQKNRQIAANNYSLGNAGFMPIIGLDAARTFSSNDTRLVRFSGDVQEVDEAKSSRISASALFNWTIFDGMGMFIAYERLAELQAAGIENAKIVMENSVANVNAAYYNIIQQQEKVNAFEDALKISEQRMALARDQYEVGAGSKLNFSQAQVDYNTDKAALILQQQRLQSAKINLNELLARSATTDFAVSDTIIVAEDLNISILKESALQRNPDILLAQRNQNVAYLDIKALQAERLPALSLIADYTYSQQQAQVGFALSNRVNGYTYGARLTMNIFNGFNQKRRIRNARINQEIEETRLKEVQTQIEADLERAFNDYQNSLVLIALEKENLAIARQNIDIAFERYKLGVATPLELREVQRNAVATESRLIDAEYAGKLAEVELLRLSSQIIE